MAVTSTKVQTVIVKTASEFLSLLSPGNSGQFRHKMLYRGVGGDYPLIASAHREPKTFRESVRNQFRLFDSFCTIADGEGLPIPWDSLEFRTQLEYWRIPEKEDTRLTSWPPPLFLPALALGQHHRLPTCFLDFTTNPYVAAYFGAKEAARGSSDHKEIVVWAVHWMAESKDGPVELVRAPMADNANMRAQEGCFLMYRPDHSQIEPLVDAQFEPIPIETFLPGRASQVTLPSSHCGALLEELARHGVKGARLFPGYEGVVAEVKERAYFPSNS